MRLKMAAVCYVGFSEIWFMTRVLFIIHHCTRFGAKILIEAQIQDGSPSYLELISHSYCEHIFLFQLLISITIQN